MTEKEGLNLSRKESWYKGIKQETFDHFMINIEKEMDDNEYLKEFKVVERSEEGYPRVFYVKWQMPHRGL